MSKINIMLHDRVLAEIENKPVELSKESDNFEYNLGLLTHMVKEALYFEPTMPRPYKYVLVHPDFYLQYPTPAILQYLGYRFYSPKIYRVWGPKSYE